MNWLLIAFIAPLLWAMSNFIDKFLISKYFKSGAGTLIVYSCLIGFPVALLIFLFNPEVINVNIGTSLLIILNGMFYISYLFFYFKALDKADTSTVIPLFQIIPVMGYFLAFFILGENLSKMQVFASSLILLGAVGISMKFEGRKTKLRTNVILLMLLASFIISLSTIMFKFFAIDIGFWTVSFWEAVGSLIFGVIILTSVKKYRNDFLSSFKKNGKRIIGVNIMNETISTVAVVIFTFATLLAPVSLIMVINGFQPLFVLLLGTALTLFAPHLVKENLETKVIIQKILFIALMLIGALLLGRVA